MRCGLAIVLATALGLATANAADEITTVTLTAAGPDAPVPVGKAFYLAGTASTDTTSVQVFIVRKGSRALWGDHGPTCTVVKQALHADSSSKATIAPGVHEVHEVYPAATAYQNDEILASAAWQRGKDASGEQPFKLLVSSDSEFYSPGFSFCLLVETSHQKVTQDSKTIEASIDQLVKKLAEACTTPGCNDDSALLLDYEGRLKAFAASVVKPTEQRGATPAQRAASVAKESSALILQARPLLEAALDMRKGQLRLDASLDASLMQSVTSPDLVNYGSVAPPVAPKKAKTPTPEEQHAQKLARERDDFARAVALLASWNQGLASYPPPATGHGFYFGNLDVGVLKLDADGKTIVVAASKAMAPDHVKKLDLTTDKLEAVPGLSVYDLVLLTNGRVTIDGKEWELGKLAEHFDALKRDVDAKTELPFAQDAQQRLATLVDALGALGNAKLVDHDGNPLDDGTRLAALSDLYAWQHSVALDGALLSRLDASQQAIAEWIDGKQNWEQYASGLSVSIKEAISYEASEPIPLEIEFDESTWVFSYLTPVVGYAEINADGGFAVPYVAVQLHFVPNPGNRVLWSQGGSDFWRSFAVELGFSPTINSGFGPDNRYTGYSGFAPVFGGVALHVIPYTSVTFGEALVDRKSSSLGTERPAHKLEPFIGFNVQFNIPEYVREASKVDTTVKVTP